MIDRSQVQVTIQWAKVTHQNRVKRINKPAQDLQAFIGQIRSHFKELASLEYLYDLTTNKVNQNPYKEKFVIRWHSQSPVDASVLDQSVNTVEVNSQDQYLEILCTHAIVDHNNGRISTPRFTVYIADEQSVQQAKKTGNASAVNAQKGASSQQAAENQLQNKAEVLQALDLMSPLKVDGAGGARLAQSQQEEEQKQKRDADSAALSVKSLNQSVPVSAVEDDEDYFVVEGNDSDSDQNNIKKALEREAQEEKKGQQQQEPAISKSQAILKGLFGEDAEEGKSLDGDEGYSEGDENAEEQSPAVNEKSYSLVEDDQDEQDDGKKPPRGSMPFGIAQDLEEEKSKRHTQTDEQIKSEMMANTSSNPLSKNEDNLTDLVSDLESHKKDSVQNQQEHVDELPLSSRIPSISLPQKPSVGNQENDDNEVADCIPVVPKKSDASFQVVCQDQNNQEAIIDNDGSCSSSDSGSDIDIFDALESSQELQNHLRQYIRNELEEMGPKILRKVKTDLKLIKQVPAASAAAAQESNQYNLPLGSPILPELQKRESWQTENNREDSSSLVAVMSLNSNQQPQKQDSEEMKGGWSMDHIHNQKQSVQNIVNDENAGSLAAPDKEMSGAVGHNPMIDEARASFDEPVIVEHEEDEVLKRDRMLAEKYINIHMKADLEVDPVQPPVKQQQACKKESLIKSIFSNVKDIANEIIHPSVSKYQNKVELVNGPDFAEVYTEVTRTEGKRAHLKVIWKLKNTNDNYNWSQGLQVVPCVSFPTLRVHWESNICQLESLKNGILKVHVQLPEDFKSNHLILLLKIRQPNGKFIGPNMLLFAKIINKKVYKQEISAFAPDNCLEDTGNSSGRNSIEQRQEQIDRGMDVYSEQQLLSMGSILADEGFGSFDRCMHVLRALRGDIENSRQHLIKLINAETQFY